MRLAGLRTLKLYVAVSPSSSSPAVPGMNVATAQVTYVKLMNSLILANAPTLTSLSLVIYAPLMEHLLQGVTCFPILDELECCLEHLSLPAFKNTGHIRTFIVYPSINSNEVVLRRSTFPNLTNLTCHPNDLRRIFTRQGDPRSIHTISLNYVGYDRTPPSGVRCSYACDITRDNDGTAYSWPTLLPCLTYLQHKYVGRDLRHLSMLVRSLDVGSMQKVKFAFLGLESLCFVVEQEPSIQRLLELLELLREMKRVHMLIISDSLVKSKHGGSPFRFADDRALQRAVLDLYSEHVRSLRRVAFTMALEWEKRTDGWYVWGEN
ncbi:hypothetical protein C8Q76DRAFT_796800 [Earliella scabrosa]|nr:hypothetical protein C8Q76DRAFT_796800 [Earliella scabrosa]